MKEKPVPTPLPLPLPPLETRTVHLLASRRTLHTTMSSPRSSLPSLSTSSSSPSSSSSIPFSWEHEPGVPKNPIPNSQTLSLPLPLPPSRHTSTSTGSPSPRSKSSTRTKTKSDPFSTALSECAKEGFEYVPISCTGTNNRRGGTMVVPAMSSRLGLLDMYGCKAAISVVDAVVSMPRPVRRHGTYRLVKRQTGTEKI